MPKGSPELTTARREEIINACEQLYKTMQFKDITIKEIGNVTSFTRTSIYNYFQTKEEIFLALFKREFDLWVEALQEGLAAHDILNNDGIADLLAKTLSERTMLLKILSVSHYDLEENSRLECLADFKKSYGKSLTTLDCIIEKFRPDMEPAKRQDFLYSFFAFMVGIYPYTFITPKQRAAMNLAGIVYETPSVYKLTYTAVMQMLK